MRHNRPAVLRHLCLAALLLACALAAPAISLAQEIEVAGELFVDLDARDETAGTEVWVSQGTLIEFNEVGDPVLTEHDGAPAVSFNGDLTNDAYESAELAPPGLVDQDCTRTIEVWTYNPDILSEETLVAWGKRGGPNGTNMSFNYGFHVLFSAVGHWGGEFPDLGWGAVPPASQWHHLVYTYDGAATRVYQDGYVSNVEYLGPGIINSHDNTKISLAAQYLQDGINLDFGAIRGTLSLGKVRIHDEVLEPEQVLNNYFVERPDFPLLDEAPSILNAPLQDFVNTGAATYTYQLRTAGFPLPTFAVVEPTGATVSLVGLIEYILPAPEPASFRVTVRAANPSSTAEASWTVTVLKGDQIQAAGELFVDLDGRDPSAGTASWANSGSLSDFVEIGDPLAVTIDGAPGVSFNLGATLDAYTSVDDAPSGLIDLDPTRSIEVWVHNPDVAAEESMVSWGHRGGPDGSNMSFNCGNHQWYGAVTHWGGSHQDLGWTPNDPLLNQWNHLAYTYDGTTTRVYLNGVEAAWEGLGPNQINTYGLTKITLAAQVLIDGSGPDLGPTRGTLNLGRVRVHDEVLTPAQVLNNYRVERPFFPLPPTAAFTATPEEGNDPLRVTLDANSSTSPNGPISTYSWDFGDGQNGQGAVVVHDYPNPGRYTVNLTITDIRGADASATRTVTVNFRPESVSPWTSADVGDAPLVMGGARPAAGGCFVVYAGGRDISRSADQFHFVYQALSGDASVVARVNAADLPPNAKLGVMLREDLSAGSRHASILLQNAGAGRYTFLRRENPSATTRPPVNSTNSFSIPNSWVKIERQGGTLIGSWSLDGATWTELGRAAVAMAPNVFGGIAAAAVDTAGNYTAVRATLCDVSVTGGVVAPTAPTGLAATAGNGQVALDWNDNPEPDVTGYNVYRGAAAGGPYQKANGAVVAASGHTDTGLTNGTKYYYVVRAVGPGGESAASAEVSATPVAGQTFRRGDLDSNGALEITDAVSLLNYLFLGQAKPACLEAGDADNNGDADISDAIANLNYQFLGGAPPADPGPTSCGVDPAQPFLGCDRGC